MLGQVGVMLKALDDVSLEFPATNQDGTANQAARDAAVNSTMDNAITAGIIQPALLGTTADAVKKFAVAQIATIEAYKTATKRPSLPVAS